MQPGRLTTHPIKLGNQRESCAYYASAVMFLPELACAHCCDAHLPRLSALAHANGDQGPSFLCMYNGLMCLNFLPMAIPIHCGLSAAMAILPLARVPLWVKEEWGAAPQFSLNTPMLCLYH